MYNNLCFLGMMKYKINICQFYPYTNLYCYSNKGYVPLHFILIPTWMCLYKLPIDVSFFTYSYPLALFSLSRAAVSNGKSVQEAQIAMRTAIIKQAAASQT